MTLKMTREEIHAEIRRGKRSVVILKHGAHRDLKFHELSKFDAGDYPTKVTPYELIVIWRPPRHS